MSVTQSGAVADLRLRLLANGYEPVPIIAPDEPVRSAGKRPRLADWASIAITPDAVRGWAATLARDTNTGIRCGVILGVDIDVPTPDLARAVEDLAIAMFGPTPLRRVGRAPKVLLAYRAAEPGPKVETPELILPDGTKVQVEVLGRGQQFVSHGVHPETRQPYLWTAHAPEAVALADLPPASPSRVRAFVAAAEALFREAGGRTEKEIKAAARPEPTPAPRPAVTSGGGFFRKVNARALAASDRWVPRLFSRARWQANATTPPGAWRVSSSDLGRGLEEDISIHPAEGCQDFGTRESLTPIDLVMRHAGAPDAIKAALYLCDALGVDPADLGWKAPGDAGQDAEQPNKAPPPWPEPAMSILRRSAGAPPEMPLDCFPSAWRAWIEVAAEGANAPPDFIVLPLLALSSALIGNARWAMPWKGWSEPPALWCASVGDPSSGKSSGAAPIMRDVLASLENDMRRDYPAELAKWEEEAGVAAATQKAWESAVKRAFKNGEEPPPRPEAARPPQRPVLPRVKVQDATIEKIGDLMSALPKGVLHVRDELAGWLLNLSRYSGGNDRPFWLESYNGGQYQVDRQKHPEPIFIARLTLPMFGTIQPDRLADCLEGADDGLASRFLWAWPTPRTFKRPGGVADAEIAAGRLARLERLQCPRNAADKPVPAFIPFAESARVVLEDFAQEMQRREGDAHGLLKSSYGKARGQAARLALVLEYLNWTVDGRDAPEPREVGLQAMQDAAGMMDGYFLPMAARVLGDASIPETERQARTLAEWIVAMRPEMVNVSAIRDGARLPGLRETDAVKEACAYLAEGGWLREAPVPAKPGRPRGDWQVNPRLWAAQA